MVYVRHPVSWAISMVQQYIKLAFGTIEKAEAAETSLRTHDGSGDDEDLLDEPDAAAETELARS